jgi:hypothetical protein
MIIRRLEVNGKTVVLTEDVIRELHRQEHIEEGKLMVERFAPKDIYNKMTDDDFDKVVDEFEYILNTTNDDTAEMMEEAVKNITQQINK